MNCKTCAHNDLRRNAYPCRECTRTGGEEDRWEKPEIDLDALTKMATWFFCALIVIIVLGTIILAVKL